MVAITGMTVLAFGAVMPSSRMSAFVVPSYGSVSRMQLGRRPAELRNPAVEAVVSSGPCDESRRAEALFDAQRLRVVVARMKIVASEEELGALMARIDSDNDGVISFAEFVEFVTHRDTDDGETLVGRLRRALQDNSSKRSSSTSLQQGEPSSAWASKCEDSSWLCEEALKTEFEALSRVQHEARILDGGARHASSYDAKDWTRVLTSWPSSFVVRRIRSPLFGLSVWAMVVAAAHRLGADASNFVLSTILGAAAPGAGITKTLTLAGAALSLLLVFRTNTAYQRYAEGRKVWEMLCSAARDSAEFSAIYISEMGERRVRRVADLLCAFPLALQIHLQGQSIPLDPREDLERAFAKIADAPLRPSCGRMIRRRVHMSPAPMIDGERAVPLDVFVAACRADERLSATFSLPSDVDARVALQQLHQLKFGSPRDKDRPVSLGELEAYYSPLALARVLPADVRADLARTRCAPLEISRFLMREAKAIPYDTERFTSRERLALMNNVAKLRACIGSAERIAQTPGNSPVMRVKHHPNCPPPVAVPLHYARHALRFLSLWSILLPFALVEQLGFLVVPVTAFMVWALYGLREIGTLIENPFSRPLQLQIVSETLFMDVREAVDHAVRHEVRPTEHNSASLKSTYPAATGHSSDDVHAPAERDYFSIRRAAKPFRFGGSGSPADYLSKLETSLKPEEPLPL